jgi:hypothetical protein
MEVKVNRTEVCDATHKLVTDVGKLILPRSSSELEEYINQMCNIAKIKETNEKTQVSKFRYVKLNPDHYRHATNYMWLAAAKVGITREKGSVEPISRRSKKKLDWMVQ